MSPLLSWLVGAMVAWVPVASTYALARYEAIAHDASIVAFDNREPPLFADEFARSKTALMLLSIASYESFFLESIENGQSRGDGGKSWCLMQINLGWARVELVGDEFAYSATKGWSGKDLASDRQKCFRAALHFARASLRQCGNLSVYTTGRCIPNETTARQRWNRATAFLQSEPPLASDGNVLFQWRP